MHNFAAMDEVDSTLQQLAQREPPLTRAMPREPGAREVRYVHLLSPAEAASRTQLDSAHNAPVASARALDHVPATVREDVADRIRTLESELAQLRARIASLEDKLTQLTG
jgi:hypothetical protein